MLVVMFHMTLIYSFNNLLNLSLNATWQPKWLEQGQKDRQIMMSHLNMTFQIQYNLKIIWLVKIYNLDKWWIANRLILPSGKAPSGMVYYQRGCPV